MRSKDKVATKIISLAILKKEKKEGDRNAKPFSHWINYKEKNGGKKRRLRTYEGWKLLFFSSSNAQNLSELRNGYDTIRLGERETPDKRSNEMKEKKQLSLTHTHSSGIDLKLAGAVSDSAVLFSGRERTTQIFIGHLARLRILFFCKKLMRKTFCYWVIAIATATMAA